MLLLAEGVPVCRAIVDTVAVNVSHKVATDGM